MTLFEKLSHFVHRLSPTFPDADATRRSRLVVWFMLVLQTQVLTFVPLYLVLGAPIVSALVFTVGVTLTTVPTVLRRTSTSIGSNWLLVQLMTVLDVIAWYTGVEHAPAIYWTAISPVLATMVSGRKQGLVWLGLILLNACALYGATTAGLGPPSVLAPAMADVLIIVAVGGLAFVVFGVAASYESATAHMMASLDQANREMRHLLDNIAEGFFTASANGSASAQHTLALETWFGAPLAGSAPFWQWLGANDAAFRQGTALSWPDAFEDVMPVDVVLEQLPKTLRDGNRTFRVSYRPLAGASGKIENIMVFVSDISAEVAADAAERAMRERATLFERLSTDRRGFITFFDECEALLASLAAANARALPTLHTLKGTTALYGCESMSQACHALESRLQDSGESLTPADHAALMSVWSRATKRVALVLQEERDRLTVPSAEVAQLVVELRASSQHSNLANRVSQWSHLPTAEAFARLGEQATALSSRLGKGTPRIQIDDHGVRVDPREWRAVLASLVHVVRNAVDHGFDTPAERSASGKDAQPGLLLHSRTDADGSTVIEIRDDGRGVNWERVRVRAKDSGLAHETRQDLVSALFSAQFSTAEEVTDISGRGVGMTALAEACAAMHATIEVESATSGGGTTVRIRRAASVGQRSAA